MAAIALRVGSSLGWSWPVWPKALWHQWSMNLVRKLDMEQLVLNWIPLYKFVSLFICFLFSKNYRQTSSPDFMMSSLLKGWTKNPDSELYRWVSHEIWFPTKELTYPHSEGVTGLWKWPNSQGRLYKIICIEVVGEVRSLLLLWQFFYPTAYKKHLVLYRVAVALLLLV